MFSMTVRDKNAYNGVLFRAFEWKRKNLPIERSGVTNHCMLGLWGSHGTHVILLLGCTLGWFYMPWGEHVNCLLHGTYMTVRCLMAGLLVDLAVWLNNR